MEYANNRSRTSSFRRRLRRLHDGRFSLGVAPSGENVRKSRPQQLRAGLEIHILPKRNELPMNAEIHTHSPFDRRQFESRPASPSNDNDNRRREATDRNERIRDVTNDQRNVQDVDAFLGDDLEASLDELDEIDAALGERDWDDWTD